MRNKLVLASASPRRSELLAQAGFTFETDPSRCEEKPAKGRPCDAVRALARQKAEDVAARHENAVILGSDTVVACDGKILGKPHGKADAAEMLRMLSGRTHFVYTGVCIIEKLSGERHETVFYRKTAVTFYPMTDAEIDRYIATGEPMDKAGAYGAQGKAMSFVKRIDGEYGTVVGLPIASVYQILKDTVL